jgi:hypothetical protein
MRSVSPGGIARYIGEDTSFVMTWVVKESPGSAPADLIRNAATAAAAAVVRIAGFNALDSFGPFRGRAWLA